MSLLSALQKWTSRGHVWLYRKTGGRVTSMGDRLVLVTTTGAKSHVPRTTPMIGLDHGDGWVVAAAAGRDHNPGWYHNMIADPEIIVERNRRRYRMVAREAVGPERDALWQRIVEEEPSYASFQEKTERLTPVMVLEPAAIETSTRQPAVTSSIWTSRSEEGSER